MVSTSDTAKRVYEPHGSRHESNEASFISVFYTQSPSISSSAASHFTSLGRVSGNKKNSAKTRKNALTRSHSHPITASAVHPITASAVQLFPPSSTSSFEPTNKRIQEGQHHLGALLHAIRSHKRCAQDLMRVFLASTSSNIAGTNRVYERFSESNQHVEHTAEMLERALTLDHTMRHAEHLEHSRQLEAGREVVQRLSETVEELKQDRSLTRRELIVQSSGVFQQTQRLAFRALEVTRSNPKQVELTRALLSIQKEIDNHLSSIMRTRRTVNPEPILGRVGSIVDTILDAAFPGTRTMQYFPAYSSVRTLDETEAPLCPQRTIPLKKELILEKNPPRRRSVPHAIDVRQTDPTFITAYSDSTRMSTPLDANVLLTSRRLAKLRSASAGNAIRRPIPKTQLHGTKIIKYARRSTPTSESIPTPQTVCLTRERVSK